MNTKARNICDEYCKKGCRTANCPLAEACTMRPKDTFDTFSDRMNKAAEEVEEVG